MRELLILAPLGVLFIFWQSYDFLRDRRAAFRATAEIATLVVVTLGLCWLATFTSSTHP